MEGNQHKTILLTDIGGTNGRIILKDVEYVFHCLFNRTQITM